MSLIKHTHLYKISTTIIYLFQNLRRLQPIKNVNIISVSISAIRCTQRRKVVYFKTIVEIITTSVFCLHFKQNSSGLFKMQNFRESVYFSLRIIED